MGKGSEKSQNNSQKDYRDMLMNGELNGMIYSRRKRISGIYK